MIVEGQGRAQPGILVNQRSWSGCTTGLAMAQFFIDRPVFAWVIAISQMPVAHFPSVTPPSVSIFASYPGDMPQTLNDSIVSLVQRALSSVKNLLYFESSADTLGLATITVTVDRRGSGRSCPRSCDPPAVDGQRPPRSTGRW